MVSSYHVISLLSQIYVDGPILEAVQRSSVFPDSKHFVDMPLKKHPIAVLEAFRTLRGESESGSPSNPQLKSFLRENFEEPGGELRSCSPPDWKEAPEGLGRLKTKAYADWATELNKLWPDLCRRVRDEVRRSPELHSILWLPHNFIIPGGRFREFYYWDTYWILKGLLVSDMLDTAAGMIRNLAFMIRSHGFVPNGGRVYYLLRSQPPLFSAMVYDYYLASGDVEFVTEMLPAMEAEYEFWVKRRSTPFEARGVELFRYFRHHVKTKVPRPESWREDRELASHLNPGRDRHQLYSDVASAAETGWDFSARWFARDSVDMKSVRTSSIVPADLNAFMCMNSRILANFHEIVGSRGKATLFQRRYAQAKAEMALLHWNETEGTWFDYDLSTQSQIPVWYLSNSLPLFARCYESEEVPAAHLAHLRRSGVLDFPKGVPTSLRFDSEQQWDRDNAWPPLVHMLIEGFRTAGGADMRAVAESLAQKWLRISLASYRHTSAMFEKYNASGVDEAASGAGGEYEVQTGFGWTNGVVLDLMAKFDMDKEPQQDPEGASFRVLDFSAKELMKYLFFLPLSLLIVYKFIRVH